MRPSEGFYFEAPGGRIVHRAEPVMLVLALLVIPAIVLEETASATLRGFALALNILIWVGFAVELVFVLAVSGWSVRIASRSRCRGSAFHGSRGVLVAFSESLAGEGNDGRT